MPWGSKGNTGERRRLWRATSDWRCAYCRRILIPPGRGSPKHGRATTVDHKLPLSRGGKKRCPMNVVLACADCNQLKGDLTLEEFEAGVAYLVANDFKLQRTKTGLVPLRHMAVMRDFDWLALSSNGRTPAL